MNAPLAAIFGSTLLASGAACFGQPGGILAADELPAGGW
jgi:hypothetical protein